MKRETCGERCELVEGTQIGDRSLGDAHGSEADHNLRTIEAPPHVMICSHGEGARAFKVWRVLQRRSTHRSLARGLGLNRRPFGMAFSFRRFDSQWVKAARILIGNMLKIARAHIRIQF